MERTIDLQSLLPPKLLKIDPQNDQLCTEVNKRELKGRHVLLYFSAHWCPPCRAFTPELAQVYQSLKKKDVDVEVIFVSHDNNLSQFESYFHHMAQLGGAWLAVPYVDGKERMELAKQCSVSGIPTLTVVGQDGKILAPNARNAVMKDGVEGFPWEGASSGGGTPPVLILVALLLFTFLLPRLLETLFSRGG